MHGCPRHWQPPKTRRVFWSEKFDANRRRHSRIARALRRDGWTVLTVWEHALRRTGGAEAAANRIVRVVAARRAASALPTAKPQLRAR
jgi:DNA mismatch endonuclease (patch repair protein)